MAKLCHQRGARVVVGDLKLVPEAQRYLDGDGSQAIRFQRCDVTSWTDLHNLITASVNWFGNVPDVYVPSAGVFEPSWSNFWDDNEDGSYKMIQINVSHPVKLTRLAMRALASADKPGVVCLIASSAGIRGNYLASLYATSKHAIVGFVKSMGQADIDEGVKIVCVLPGFVQSPLWEDREDDMTSWTKYTERLKSALQPDDIADVMLRMIESADYDGGTCVLKTKAEERIVEDGFSKQAQKYDPSPRPEPDLTRIKSLLSKDRGKPWL